STCEGFRLQAQEAKIVAGICNSRLDRDGHIRFQRTEFGEQYICTEKKIARIPQITFAYVARSSSGIRLFDETFNGMRATGDGLARKNITVIGLRLGRLDAKGDNMSGLRGGAAGAARSAEGIDIENDVVGGQCQDDSPRVAGGGNRSRRRD